MSLSERGVPKPKKPEEEEELGMDELVRRTLLESGLGITEASDGTLLGPDGQPLPSEFIEFEDLVHKDEES